MGIKRKERAKNLRAIFIQYLLFLVLLTLVLLVLVLGAFTFAMASGTILPANYAEKEIAKQKPLLISADEITPEMIPKGCNYALYDTVDRYMKGTIPLKRADSIKSSLKNGIHTRSGLLGTGIGAKYQIILEGKSQSCILEYSLTPQFASPFLRNLFPSPEISALLVFLAVFFVGILFLSGYFGRYVGKKLTGLKEAAEKIKVQNLDFSIKDCGIKEIDEILHSLEQMKTELKNSLERQWNMEQAKKEQIAALAHDIKTPLTIIRGNAELLEDIINNAQNIVSTENINNLEYIRDIENNKIKEQKEYIDYISKNVKQIEEYMKALMEISNSENVLAMQPGIIVLPDFIEKIYNQTQALANKKSLTIKLIDNCNTAEISMDETLMQRALMNVISNAVDYSPEGGILSLQISSSGEAIRFRVTDAGRGFSKEEMKSAPNQFYMGDSSRTSRNHYGLGLYITDTIVKLHGGSLYIANSPATGGGQVTLEIPIMNR